jgi:hypothetical protein
VAQFAWTALARSDPGAESGNDTLQAQFKVEAEKHQVKEGEREARLQRQEAALAAQTSATTAERRAP